MKLLKTTTKTQSMNKSQMYSYIVGEYFKEKLTFEMFTKEKFKDGF